MRCDRNFQDLLSIYMYNIYYIHTYLLNWTRVSRIAGRRFTVWATWGVPIIVRVSFKSFLHILLVCFNVPWIFWIQVFLCLCDLWIFFSQPIACLFYFINVIFSGTKGFILVNLSLFFKDHAFGFTSNNSLPKYGHE